MLQRSDRAMLLAGAAFVRAIGFKRDFYAPPVVHIAVRIDSRTRFDGATQEAQLLEQRSPCFQARPSKFRCLVLGFFSVAADECCFVSGVIGVSDLLIDYPIRQANDLCIRNRRAVRGKINIEILACGACK
ncbi:hypothetical protein [Burkholderia vietnamiensis]|uniref:hypothetical protein n=1 Tax=Burkholderia vietnamiensis TaxID=60552 RepID=UPI002DD440F1|nr:hypothetical protein [Burkholderia vietnamiensis]MEC4597126.1 hypothetical protein [Burkholderia vietnamiensis]